MCLRLESYLVLCASNAASKKERTKRTLEERLTLPVGNCAVLYLELITSRGL